MIISGSRHERYNVPMMTDCMRVLWQDGHQDCNCGVSCGGGGGGYTDTLVTAREPATDWWRLTERL